MNGRGGKRYNPNPILGSPALGRTFKEGETQGFLKKKKVK